MKTLEDILIERGEVGAEPGEVMTCPACVTDHALFSIVNVENDPRFAPHVVVCSTCYLAAITPPPVSPTGWETERGLSLKGERIVELNRVRWTIMPDSPLSESSQAEWRAYMGRLHRMTVDCADPADWIWPNPPSLAYP